jgi:hypothetical protein
MAFEHTDGAPPPSQLPSYASAARAIVAGEPSLFTPGSPNVDWRLHIRGAKRPKRPKRV